MLDDFAPLRRDAATVAFAPLLPARRRAACAVYDDAAAEVPRDREPLVLDDDSLAVGALVGDVLVPALPLAAHCNNNDCSRSEPAPREGGKRRDNPFAGLADWKRGN